MNSGVIPSPPDIRDYPVSAIVPAVLLPAEVRMDDKVLSIRDQWVFPTCVGKSGASIMSAGLREELSSVFIYSKCKELDGIPNLPGTYPRIACRVMLHYGTCTTKTLPYSQMSDPVPKLKAAHYAEASSRKIKQYARATRLKDIKLALANGHLVMGCMLVGDNFVFQRGDTTVGPPTGELHGYHAIVVCGYSDARQAVRIANSWGSLWGDNGFSWLSYSVLNNPVHWPEAWVIEVGQEEPKKAAEIYPDRIFRELKRYLKKKTVRSW